MRSYKRWAAIAIGAALLGGSLVSCAPDSTPVEDDEVRIAYFSFAADNTYSQAIFAGIESAASQEGATAELFDGGFDAAIQTAAIEDALASGKFDAFVISSNDGNAVVPVVEDAIAAGIKVVAHFTPIGPKLDTLDQQVDGLTATVGYPLVSNALAFAQMFINACADRSPCETAFMPGISTLPLDVIRIGVIEEELAKHSNIEMVAVIDGGYDPTTGYEATQDLLAAHPDIDVIGTAGDQSAGGVELALNDLGLKDVLIFGNGASKPGVEAVKDGRWFGSYVNVPFTEGERIAELVFAAIAGDDTYHSVDAEALSPIGAILSKENVGRFTAQWEG